MSNVADLELSKKLYKLSGWDNESRGCYVYSPDDEDNQFYTDEGIGDYLEWLCPAYDAGYLLRKLPYEIKYEDNELGLVLEADINCWWAGYEVYDYAPFLEADDTPENALCKLAIKLFEEGILEPENGN